MAAIFRKRYLLWLLLPAAGYTAVLYYLIVAQSVINEARVADAIVVFGAAEYDGRPSPVYKARLDHASQLYHRSLAPSSSPPAAQATIPASTKVALVVNTSRRSASLTISSSLKLKAPTLLNPLGEWPPSCAPTPCTPASP